ncbi:hypothetical protein [Paenirhodobacter sp.]|uniref:hypothetical protein n=1 Tax=Paenirhodobacter sp. TaxID=1965326 RepID=UPI003B407F04
MLFCRLVSGKWRKKLLEQHPDLMPALEIPAPTATVDIDQVELVIGDATIRVGSEIGEAALTQILRTVRSGRDPVGRRSSL